MGTKPAPLGTPASTVATLGLTSAPSLAESTLSVASSPMSASAVGHALATESAMAAPVVPSVSTWGPDDEQDSLIGGAGDLQESDLMEKLPSGKVRAPPDTDHIRLVSLGHYCGPKLTFQKVGRGSETLPFDWMRTHLDGLLKFIRTDFEGFFDFKTRQEVPNTEKMVMYRNSHHSFWHDDPRSPVMQERYRRRFRRFDSIDANTTAVLFVRSAVSSDEVARVDELYDALRSRFGNQACLLLMVDFQSSATGAATLQGRDNLLVHFVPADVHTDSGGAPYEVPVLSALDWVVGRPIVARPFPDLDTMLKFTDSTKWGLAGLGGLAAFEDVPPTDSSSAAAKKAAPTPCVVTPTSPKPTATVPLPQAPMPTAAAAMPPWGQFANSSGTPQSPRPWAWQGEASQGQLLWMPRAAHQPLLFQAPYAWQPSVPMSPRSHSLGARQPRRCVQQTHGSGLRGVSVSSCGVAGFPSPSCGSMARSTSRPAVVWAERTGTPPRTLAAPLSPKRGSAGSGVGSAPRSPLARARGAGAESAAVCDIAASRTGACLNRRQGCGRRWASPAGGLGLQSRGHAGARQRSPQVRQVLPCP